MKTDKITSSYEINLGETQKSFDVNVQNSNDKAIKQVLSTTGEAYIDEVEMINGEAHYSGDLVLKLLYVDENGENNVLSERVDINGKLLNDNITPFEKPIFSVEIVNIKVEDVNDNGVKLVVTLNFRLDAIKTDETSSVEVDGDDVAVQKEAVTLTNVVSDGSKSFVIEEEFDTKANVKRVLLSTHHLKLNNVSSGTGYFAVDGDLMVNSVLEVETEDGLALKNFMQTISFKEEFEDEKLEKTDDILAFLSINPSDFEVNLVSSEVESEEMAPKNSVIKVEAKVNVRYIAERQMETEIVTDAFSMTNKTNVVTETFTTAKPTQFEKFSATIDGQTTIEGEPRIAKICAVTNEHILVANSGVVNGKLSIEGVAYATVVYQTDDDGIVFNSVDLEIPYSNKFDVKDDFDASVFVTADIVDVDAKARKGKEVMVSMDVCFLALGYQTETKTTIKDLELLEELPTSEYSLEMYIAPKGSTLWDVARHLHITEEVLKTQNPELTFPLAESKTVVYYRKK